LEVLHQFRNFRRSLKVYPVPPVRLQIIPRELARLRAAGHPLATFGAAAGILLDRLGAGELGRLLQPARFGVLA